MSIRTAVLLTCLASSIVGCAPFNYVKDDAPKPIANLRPFEPNPNIALVLGAGGPRGFAHIGVMKMLDEACIDIDLVVGSSVGSLLGVFWASGLSAVEIDQLSRTGGPLSLFDPTPFADRGWIRGSKLQNFVNDRLENKPLEELPRRVIVVTTDRTNKETRYITTGNSGVAVRASSAVPGIISPVGINGVEYEDGDVSAPLAVTAARAAGAKFVIAVNVYPKPESIPEDASDKNKSRVIRRARQIAPQAALADFVIHAETPFYASPRKRFFNASRDVGKQVALENLAALKIALQEQGVTIDRFTCN